MNRVPSRLPDEIETVVSRVVGCLITVHRSLGAGLLESVYGKAIAIELETAAILFEREKEFPVRYRGRQVAVHRLDFVIGQTVVLEIKSVERLTPLHGAPALTYLRIAHLPVALLVKFNVPILKQAIKRIIL